MAPACSVRGRTATGRPAGTAIRVLLMDSVAVDDDAPTVADAGAVGGEQPWELRLREALVDAARARLERRGCSGRDGHA